MLWKPRSMLDKTPMTYKLLFKTFIDTASDTSKTMTDIVIVGGQEDNTVCQVCLKVDQSNQIVQMCHIPVDDLTPRLSVCKTPLRFAITGGVENDLCIMYVASTRFWLRLQDLKEERRCHGSICVKDVLYVLGGYLGEYTDSSEPSDSVDFMIINKGDWKNGPRIPLAVKFPKVSNLGDSVYSTFLMKSPISCCVLTLKKNVWIQLASLSTEKRYCLGASMASAQDRLLVVGGKDKICARYIPETNTWFTGHKPLKTTHLWSSCLPQ